MCKKKLIVSNIKLRTPLLLIIQSKTKFLYRFVRIYSFLQFYFPKQSLEETSVYHKNVEEAISICCYALLAIFGHFLANDKWKFNLLSPETHFSANSDKKAWINFGKQ